MLSLKLGSLLIQRPGQWFAVVPLFDVRDPKAIGRALANSEPGRDGSVIFLDLKTESDRLLAQYDREAVTLASLGTLAITALLLVHFRSIRKAFVVLAPLAIAVLLTIALLTIGGRALSIFNLFGLLLVVAVGSNYCLFFQRGGMNGPAGERMATSLLLANICTVIGFGALSISRLPVLYGLGSTVAIGTALSLVTAAILTSRPASTGGKLMTRVTIIDQALAETTGDNLLVLLPGAGMTGEDFRSHGFIDTVRRNSWPTDIMLADPGVDFYLENEVAVRLRDEIIRPPDVARPSRLWLAGISLGGLGALLYAQAYPEEVAGLLLIAPFVGSRGLITEIERAGGLRDWQPGETATPERGLLAWLRTYAENTPGYPSVYLGLWYRGPICRRTSSSRGDLAGKQNPDPSRRP